MYRIIRKIFFKIDAEQVHAWVMKRLVFAYSVPAIRRALRAAFVLRDPTLERRLWGMTFPNPVGLAAGFDKDAKYTDALSCLGFGFIEIGTVTPRPQPGNPKPRLFRLPADGALINRMGFNNDGSAQAALRLKRRRERIIIGGNIGKNKLTPNEEAADDYETCFRDLHKVVDYFVVNVSSPNTPGLRQLQDKEPLTALLSRLQAINDEYPKRKPILLKIAPDLSNQELDDIIEIVKVTNLDGIVATNTTISRSGLHTPSGEVTAIGAGGISGIPLRDRATEVISYISKATQRQVPIIASGGIFTAADAIEKLKAGAVLVQVYTGFIYEGPAIAKKICKGLVG